jgi:7-carboxy-7-deazaguanine synthase
LALRITEIFYSLQGEASRVGLPTVFVRLTGCPLRCVWCDTEYSFTGGAPATIESVLAEVAKYPARQVCVTGGEPLSQKECLPLLTKLCDAGYDVSLETSGALDIAAVDPRVARIMDLKAPGSGESDKNLWPNLATTESAVTRSRSSSPRVLITYGPLRSCATRHLDQCCPVLFSPAQGQIEPADLASWILEDGLPVRFQLQLHKLLWGNMRGK